MTTYNVPAPLKWAVPCVAVSLAWFAQDSTKSEGETEPPTELSMPARLRTDVEGISRPGGSRRVGSPGHAAAREYLEERLKELGCEPLASDGEERGFGLPYEVAGVEFVNLVGVVPGSDRELPPLVIGAHYDTCGDQPGADDNAAAVAAALACAAGVRGEPLSRDLWVCLFDAEEPPHFLTASMGSIVFYRSQRPREVHAVLVLDLVGHDVGLPGLEHALFSTGMECHPDMLELFAGLIGTTDLALVGTRNDYISDMSDYHVFRKAGRPWLFYSCGRWEHYHEETDTPDRLNYEKLALVSDLSLATLRQMDVKAFGEVQGKVDTLAVEIACLRPIATAVGLDAELETRDDVTALVLGLMRKFGL